MGASGLARRPASSTWPGGVPEVVAEWGDDPAGLAADTTPTPIGQGVPVSLGAKTPFDQWVEAKLCAENLLVFDIKTLGPR